MPIRRMLAVLPLFISLAAFAGEAEDIQKMLRNKQLPQALERADKFIAANPKDAQVRFLKGIIQTEMAQPGEAIKTFTALATEYPQLPEPYNNLAVLYAQQGQLDKARSALMMAIQTNPAYAIAHENLGDLYARLASQSYDKALQLENGNPNVQTKLTLVRELFSKIPATTVVAAAKPPAGKTVVALAPTPVVAPPAPVVIAPPAVVAPAKPAVVAPVKPAAPVVASLPATPAPQPQKPAVVQPDSREADKQKILATVNAWADAWSRKNVAGYLAAYDRDFRTPNGQKFNDWSKERRERITAPKSIEVKVSDLKVDIADNGSAKVRLRQSYRSDRLTTSTSKTLILQKSGGRWLIHEERTGG